MIEKADATPAVDDGVPDDPGVALVLHGDAGIGALRNVVVHDDRRAAVAQNEPVVVAGRWRSSSGACRTPCWITDIVVGRIQESVAAAERGRGALAVRVDVVIVAVVI